MSTTRLIDKRLLEHGHLLAYQPFEKQLIFVPVFPPDAFFELVWGKISGFDIDYPIHLA